MFADLLPSPLKEGIVSCILKVRETYASNEFRLINYIIITFGPVMSQLFPQIINQRMLQFWQLFARQKAFRNGDVLGHRRIRAAGEVQLYLPANDLLLLSSTDIRMEMMLRQQKTEMAKVGSSRIQEKLYYIGHCSFCQIIKNF